MDVVGCHQAGVTNAIASMGTSLTPDQARLIRRYTNHVVFLYDGDEAGVKAIERGLEGAGDGGGLMVRVVGCLAGGEDPDSYAQKNGAEALQRIVKNAMPFFDFLLQQAGRRFDLTSPEGKVHALELFEPVLAAIPEELVYEGYVSRLALAMGHEEDALRRYLKKQVRPKRAERSEGTERTGKGLPPESKIGETQSKELFPGTPPAVPGTHGDEEGILAGLGMPTPQEMGLLHILIEYGEVRDLVRERLNPEWIEHPLVRYWVTRILEIDSDVTDIWPVLIGLCGSAEQEVFLQSAVFKAEEPLEDYCSVAEYLISRIIINFQRSRGKRLNLLVQEMFQKDDRESALKIIEEQMSNLKTRINEMARAKTNACVRVKHQEYRTKSTPTL